MGGTWVCLSRHRAQLPMPRRHAPLSHAWCLPAPRYSCEGQLSAQHQEAACSLPCPSPRWVGKRGKQQLGHQVNPCLDRSWVPSWAQPSMAGGQVGGCWINIKPIPRVGQSGLVRFQTTVCSSGNLAPTLMPLSAPHHKPRLAGLLRNLQAERNVQTP